LRIEVFPFFILLFSFLISSCENPLIERIVEPREAKFETNGGSSVESQTVLKNQLIKRPEDPSKSGYNFAAWYRDNETFLEEWDFDTAPNAHITLYAKWDALGPDITGITGVAITITGPAKDAVPNTEAIGEGNFTIGAVSWDPDDDPFQANTVYTASVTLTADEDCIFAANITATINGQPAVISNNTGTTVTLSYTFAATEMLTVTGMAIKTQPRLAYTHGDKLDLSWLVVTFTYEDGSEGDIPFGEFALRNIITTPADGMALGHVTHNETPVAVSYNDFTQITGNLTVDPKAITLTDISIPSPTYTGNPLTPTVTVMDGGIPLTPGTDYTVVSSNNTNAGIETAAVTITGIGNYTGSADAKFTINKANPDVIWPTSTTIPYGATLSSSTLNGGSANLAGTPVPGSFAWTDGTIIPTVTNNGYEVTFTPGDTANYNPVTNNVSITVSKAAGASIGVGLNATNDNIGVNSVTLTAISPLANGQTVEYGCSDTYNTPPTTWKDETTFTGLAGGTPYYFYARSKANDNYEAGTSFSTTQITTLQQQGITVNLDVSELVEKGPTGYDSNIIISRSGTGYSTTATVTIDGPYYSIDWEIPGVGVNPQSTTGTSLTTPTSITLDAEDTRYNSPGWHRVNVTVRLTNGGMEYMTSFTFQIVD